MDRRQMLGVIGAGAAGLVNATGRQTQAQQAQQHDTVHAECLKACTECANVCSETFHESLSHLKNEHHVRLTELTLDCQEFCALSAKLIGRRSPLLRVSCSACAEACKTCAEECLKHDDAQVKACATACQACEKSCRTMLEHMKEHEHHTG